MDNNRTTEMVRDPISFFEELGGLHDARITEFVWSKSRGVFTLSVDDINSNFLDLPEYRGLRPAEVIFMGTESLDSDFQIVDSSFAIYAMEIVLKTNCYSVEVRCSPGGYFKLICKEIGIR